MQKEAESNDHGVAWHVIDSYNVMLCRVIPSRRRHPVAFRLYMELLKRYSFSLLSLINGPNYQKYDTIAFTPCVSGF